MPPTNGGHCCVMDTAAVARQPECGCRGLDEPRLDGPRTSTERWARRFAAAEPQPSRRALISRFDGL